MSYEDIHNRLENAGLIGPDTGKPMAVHYQPEGWDVSDKPWNYLPPSQDGKPFDMVRFHARVSLGEWAIRMATAAENCVDDFPAVGKEILEQAAEKFANAAINFRG